ncbi:MAG: PEP-CTERM sorting domain-containing protein [Myxococcota bacterium]|nr:PEP-CTERM sorting domain-containing protein [Myxococcota bacterium]
MKRWTVALVATAFWLLPSTSGAVSSIDMVWEHNGSPIANPCPWNLEVIGSCPAVTVSASSLITAAIVLRGDSVGVGSVAITILFDTAELDVVSVTDFSFQARPNGGGVNWFLPVDYGVTIDEPGGVIHGFDQEARNVHLDVPGAGCVACTVTLGSVRFHLLTGPYPERTPNDLDVIASVEPNGTDGVWAPDGSPASVVFNGATVNEGHGFVPEPGTGALVSIGVVALVAFARRR